MASVSTTPVVVKGVQPDNTNATAATVNSSVGGDRAMPGVRTDGQLGEREHDNAVGDEEGTHRVLDSPRGARVSDESQPAAATNGIPRPDSTASSAHREAQQ